MDDGIQVDGGEVSLAGAVQPVADAATRQEWLAKAFDFRGDVTLVAEGGQETTGYLFHFDSDVAELYPSDGSPPVRIPLGSIQEIRFADKDPAAGKSYQAWLKKLAEAESSGSFADLYPEPLESTDSTDSAET